MKDLSSRVSEGQDIIDSRDVIERIEELEGERDAAIEKAGENPPDDWEECGGCDCRHPKGFAGDCRDDANRWPSKKCREELAKSFIQEEDEEELKKLKELQEEAEGSSDWKYGEALIADHFFEKYAEELADDIGAIDRNAGWPLSHIDWKAAAEALQQDYTSVTYGSTTYWIRS